MSDVLPPGWVKTNLESIAFINMGQSPKSIYYNSEGKGLPFFQGKAEFGHVNPTPKKWCTNPSKIAERNDILLSVRAPVGPTNLCSEQSCIGRGLAAIRGYHGINQNFLYYYFKHIEGWLQEQGTGSTFQAINGGFIKQLSVQVPPTNEQKRIAEKLEQLLTAVDATKNRLDKVPTILKRFRQSVLAAAVSGELTKDWREKNFCSNYDIPSLLAKERKEKWSGRGKYKPAILADQVESDEFTDIPSSWYRGTLNQITWSVKDGPHFSPKYSDSGVPFISGGSIKPGKIDLSISKFISQDLHKEFSVRCKPEYLDILYTKGGTTGIAAVNTLREEFNVWVHVAVLKLISPNLVDPFYIQHALNSPECYQQSQRYTHGVGNQDLGLTRMIKIVIPIPPIEEQREIVSRIETLFAQADRMESVFNNALSKVKLLPAAILAKAFRGELVPQDPNDEPAELLLKRIAETNRQKKPGKPARRRKKAMPAKAKKGSLHSIGKILQSSEKPLSAQQLLAVLSPGSPDAEEVENFFVALRDCLTKKEIIRERKGDEDWFSLVAGSKVS